MSYINHSIEPLNAAQQKYVGLIRTFLSVLLWKNNRFIGSGKKSTRGLLVQTRRHRLISHWPSPLSTTVNSWYNARHKQRRTEEDEKRKTDLLGTPRLTEQLATECLTLTSTPQKKASQTQHFSLLTSQQNCFATLSKSAVHTWVILFLGFLFYAIEWCVYPSSHAT